MMSRETTSHCRGHNSLRPARATRRLGRSVMNDSVGKFKKWGLSPLRQRLFPSWWGIPTTFCAEEKENIPSKVEFPNRVIHYALHATRRPSHMNKYMWEYHEMPRLNL